MSQISSLVFILLALVSGIVGQFGHGEDCQSTSECDTVIGLECRNLKCACIPETVYDDVNATCRILVGGSCDDSGGGDALSCVPHARCDYNGTAGGYTCGCGSSFYIEGPDRLCHPTAEGDCELSSDCLPSNQLICTFGKCQCPNPLNQRFDRDGQACRIMVGFPCNPVDPLFRCDQNMTCNMDVGSTTGFSCECGSGYLPSFNHDRCYIDHAQPCQDGQWGEDDCDDFHRGLFCRQGSCQCGHAPAQVWDNTQKMCASLEGNKCSLIRARDQSYLPCTTGLTCVPHTGPFFGICRSIK